MPAATYSLIKAAFAIPRFAATRERILNKRIATRPSPFILAVSHLSHLEPAFVSAHVRAQVHWMARIEHYNSPLSSLFLRACDAFSVDRFGNPAPAVRHAIRLLRQSKVVGIFPEGGNATGQSSVLRNAPIKGGTATSSIATNAPIIPVVVLGTHPLNAIRPWLPTKSNPIHIAFGQELHPPPKSPTLQSRRTRRQLLTTQLQQAFVQTYQDLLKQINLSDTAIP